MRERQNNVANSRHLVCLAALLERIRTQDGALTPTGTKNNIYVIFTYISYQLYNWTYYSQLIVIIENQLKVFIAKQLFQRK
jgi:hypothetical protein